MLHRQTGLIVVGAAALAFAAVPLAKAETDPPSRAHAAAIASGDPIRAAIRNGTTKAETEIIGRFNATTGSKGGYVTRQSNTQTGANAGGGAIYGCRGAAGGTAANSAPCLRAVNLAAGYAFEFATGGGVTGTISVGDGKTPNPGARPFTTNATGVATGLNADQVDGKSATDIAATAGPPNGSAGGVLSGSYPNPGLAANAPGVATGGVDVSTGGSVTGSFNRLGGTPTVNHTGTGTYTVTFPGITADASSVPQVTLVGAGFGLSNVQTSGGAFQVSTADTTGAAADHGFALTVFSGS